MSSTVTLLMAVHCHQPVGNFDFVFEKAYAQSYAPFIGVLERHPGVKLALHYSGPLLDWLKKERPHFLKRIRQLAARGRIELLASGYYEPILPLLPEADRLGQIAMMRASIQKLFGARASGLWLTERVWEPQLPQTLSCAGIGYTMADTNQFAPAKPYLPQHLQIESDKFWDVLGSYTTDYSGRTIRLFPGSKQLRYTMPFQPVEKTLDFLRRLRRDEPVAVTFADDGEKFGLWPKTFAWVYEEGWLDLFFSALERESSWLKTDTFAHYIEETPADGHVYLPCGSYDEMLEWSHGNFRNFFSKYPEANALQQAMLRVSESLQQATAARGKNAAKLLQEARRELYAAQCNCAYWHGVFGGLYLSHLRRAVYAHLIRAECLCSRLKASRTAFACADVDGDGSDELRVATASQALVVDPQEGGTVTAWDLLASAVNLTDTLSRRPEPYHQKLRQLHEASLAGSGGQGPASIHDAVQTKEEHLTDYLLYDDHRRVLFHDYGLERMPSLEEVVRSTWSERWLWSAAPFRWDKAKKQPASAKQPVTVRMTRGFQDGQIGKRVRVDCGRSVVDFEYTLEKIQAPVVALEFNVCLRDERFVKGPQRYDDVHAFEIEEGWSGIRAALSLDKPATAYAFPIETVSDSEAGMERTYQGLCVVFLWRLEPAQRWSARIRWDCGK